MALPIIIVAHWLPTYYDNKEQIANRLILNRSKFALLCAWTAISWSAATLGFAQSPPLRVVTTFYPVYVAALNVVGDAPGVEVSLLAPPHVGCLHDYQVTPDDLRRLADADILLANGAGMETFLDKLVAGQPGLRIVLVSDGIPLLDGNPHVWVSPAGARLQLANIARALAEADPARADIFTSNARRYDERLALLEREMKAALAPFEGTPIVTFHEAFPYFAREFGLLLAGVIEREPGTEPSAGELADTVRTVRAAGVTALFVEPQFSDRAAQIIARETGAVVYELDPVVTGPKEPAQAREAYVAAMQANLVVLRAALGGQHSVRAPQP